MQTRILHTKTSAGPRWRIAASLVAALCVLTGCSSSPTRAVAPIDNPDVYPRTAPADVKGLQPDFWSNPSDNTPGLGTVSVNFTWGQWEPSPSSAPCTSSQIEFDGTCFEVPAEVDAQVREYSARGVPATAIVYGAPPWARGSRPCPAGSPTFQVFCVPDDVRGFARFAGMIASRYDGAHGHGRVSDFVIENEVNSNLWFNTGCGLGKPCDFADWVSTYASIYDASYDRIRTAQPEARVLFSFDHTFASSLDAPTLPIPEYSVQTFLTALVLQVGARQWSVAYHPYPADPNVPTLDALDYPYVTLGNIGVIVGWLRATYPKVPSAGNVELTEVGLNNPHDMYDSLQSASLCTAFTNVLGTPGVTSFIYHRLVDQSDEFGQSLGLRRQDGTPKPAWFTWLDVNDPKSPTCGYQNLPFIIVRRGVDPVTGTSRFSSRVLPSGEKVAPGGWRLHYSPVPDSVLLYECGRGRSSYLSRDVSCGGDMNLGPVGYADLHRGDGSTALYLCAASPAPLDSTSSSCTGGKPEVLGYVHTL